MIDFKGAQEYFKAVNHHKAAVWSSFSSSKTREGAVTAARRLVARELGRPLNDNEPPYREGDRTRQEFAVYEQALWMLENGQISDAAAGDPVPVLTGRPDAADRSRANPNTLLAPEAQRWLSLRNTLTIKGG